MKEIFFIEDTPANRISYWLLIVFLATLPLDRLYSELALICLLLHTVLHPARRPLPDLRWPGWLLVLLYVLTMLGTLYTHYPGGAWFEWEKQLAFLVCPFIMYYTRLDILKYQMPLMKVFAVSCLLIVLYLYATALHTIFIRHLPLSSLFSPPFLNHAFTGPIDLHATYFSMYAGLALMIFGRLLLHASSRRYQILFGVCALILVLGIMQLASRSVVIAVIIACNVLLPFFQPITDFRKAGYSYFPRRTSRRFLMTGIGITLLLVTVCCVNPSLRMRYFVQLRQDLHGNPGDANGPEPRIARWKCALELIRSSPWIGYGTGAERPLLKTRYWDHHLNDSYANELNAHNEFLSLWLKTGIIGVLIYLLLLAGGFICAFRSHSGVFAGFLVIITIVSFSENILDVNKGIFFVSFFFSFFAGPMAAWLRPVSLSDYGDKNILPMVGP